MLGLTEEKGLKGRLNQSVENIVPILNGLKESSKEVLKSELNSITILYSVIFISIILVIVVFSNRIG